MKIDPFSDEADRIISEGVRIARETLDRISAGRAEQPNRLAAARDAADQARGWSLIEEPWDDQVKTIPTYTSDGQAGSFTLPNIVAKELWGARLAFDMLDCGDDDAAINTVQSRYFAMTHGDTRLMFLIAMAALSTIASHVVPSMLDDLERRGGNWEARPLIAEARTKAWNGRVSALRDNATEEN